MSSRGVRIVAVVSLGLVLVLGWLTFFRPVPITNEKPTGSRIIAFGDSLTAGTGAGPGEDYPTQLARLIGQPVVNKGVPGDTAGGGERRLQRDVLALDPRIVIVCLGGNDLLQRIPADETFASLERTVRGIQERGALVVLVGVEGGLFIGGNGKRYARLARDTGCVYVPNILKGIVDHPKLKADQIHPNGAGYAIMAERVRAAIGRYL
jgi:lysophospholipase L1-like esterase